MKTRHLKLVLALALIIVAVGLIYKHRYQIAYRLDGLISFYCKDSVTDEEFKAYILEQIPDLKQALAEQDSWS